MLCLLLAIVSIALALPGDELLKKQAGLQEHIVSTLKESEAWKQADLEYRAKRVKLGLSPEIIPKLTYIRMRDGTLLRTLIWDPRLDPSSAAPALLIRSPYTLFGSNNMADLYLPFGYVSVEQDQRGTGGSEGDYCFWMTSRFDGKDTIDWIISQEFSNGQVFQIGASADGILSTMDIKIPQPYLFGQWLIVTTSSPYDTLFQNRQAVRQGLASGWLGAMQLYRPNVPPGTYYNTALRNEGFSAHFTPPAFDCDQFFAWPNITVTGKDFENVNFPAIHTGGWYDIFLAPQIRNFQNYDQNSSSPGGFGQQQIVIGPRGHCFFESSVSFPDDRFAWLWSYERSLDVFKNQITEPTRSAMPQSPGELYPGEAPREKWTIYVMGPRADFKQMEPEKVSGMYWSTLKELPETIPLKLYFGEDKKLVVESPLASNSSSSISFLYDPSNPTPTIGGNNLLLACGPKNQTSNDLRSDNLYFDYAFTDDTALLGSISINLAVSTSALGTDFVVRVEDLYPDGKTSILLSDNIVRMRWRNSDTVESKTEPNVIYPIALDMWQLCYVFNKGHTLRIAITSSNYPRYSANPNNGELVYKGGPLVNATNSIHLGVDSRVSIPTVSLKQLPKYGILKR